MLSLRCLVSALTQAGGGDLLLRFASSIQSCCGEGAVLQADVAVCGEHSPCSGQTSCSFGGLSPGAARLFPPRRADRVARGLRAFSPGVVCLFPSAASGPDSQRFGALSPGAVRLFPPQPQCAHRRSGLRKSFDRNRGPFAVWEGVASLGLSLPLSPPPCLLPPGGMGRLFSGVSQSLCFANRRQRVRAG